MVGLLGGVMARLNVKAAVRWASGTTSFGTIQMLLTLSVTDQDGMTVDRLTADAVRVGYQVQPEATEDFVASISLFHHNGPTFGGTGWYSCIVDPPTPLGWVQDEVFLCVTVRHPGPSGQEDRGQDILLARYHQTP